MNLLLLLLLSNFLRLHRPQLNVNKNAHNKTNLYRCYILIHLPRTLYICFSTVFFKLMIVNLCLILLNNCVCFSNNGHCKNTVNTSYTDAPSFNYCHINNIHHLILFKLNSFIIFFIVKYFASK